MVALPPVRSRVPWVGLAIGAVVLAVVAVLWFAATPPSPPVRALPPVDLPRPHGDPPVEAKPPPQPTAEPVTPPTPAAPEKPRRHTRAEVKTRWRNLRERSKDLPEDQARALQRHLARVKGCTDAVEVCWEQLSKLERDYLTQP
jgi:hypothetical protein